MNNEDAKKYYQGYNPGVKRGVVKNEFIKSLNGYGSIFEFGSNNGANLTWILEKYDNVKVFGIDINEDAVREAQKTLPLSVSIGDHNSLKEISENSYDLVFTCSVICHIPNAKETIENLKRIASKKVVLIETNDIAGEYYFKYNYEGFGFISKGSAISTPGNNCLYHQYEFEK